MAQVRPFSAGKNLLLRHAKGWSTPAGNSKGKERPTRKRAAHRGPPLSDALKPLLAPVVIVIPVVIAVLIATVVVVPVFYFVAVPV